MTVLTGIKNSYGEVLVDPHYTTVGFELENKFLAENPQYKIVSRIASVPNWIVVEDTTPRAPKKLPSKAEMISLILEKGLFKFEGTFAKYELDKFSKKTKSELANYYADALAR